MERLRGTCIAIDGLGVLLCGPSGCGKSDLALRLIDAGAELVSDDYIEVAASDGKVVATAPARLRGLLEVRGVGIIRLPAVQSVPLAAIVDLEPGEAIERMPLHEQREVIGIPLASFRMAAREASAVAKVRLAVRIARGAVVRLP